MAGDGGPAASAAALGAGLRLNTGAGHEQGRRTGGASREANRAENRRDGR